MASEPSALRHSLSIRASSLATESRNAVSRWSWAVSNSPAPRSTSARLTSARASQRASPAARASSTDSSRTSRDSSVRPSAPSAVPRTRAARARSAPASDGIANTDSASSSAAEYGPCIQRTACAPTSAAAEVTASPRAIARRQAATRLSSSAPRCSAPRSSPSAAYQAPCRSSAARSASGPLPAKRPGERRCSSAYSRTLVKSSKRSSASTRTSDFSTSACSASTAHGAVSKLWRSTTASTASSAKLPANTESCASADLSQSASCSHDQSSVARSVAWRPRPAPLDASRRKRSPIRARTRDGARRGARADGRSLPPAREHRDGRHHACARGGELDRERKTVEKAYQRRDRRVLVAGVEVGARCARALHEQLHGFGHRQRRERERLLARDAEQFARRDKEARRGRGVEPPRERL